MEVKRFTEMQISIDGKTMALSMETAEGGSLRLDIPYQQAISLAKATLSLAHEAVDRQNDRGELQASSIAVNALRAETVSVLVKPNQEFAAIDAVGIWTSNDSPGTTALLVERQTAEDLINQLRSFVRMASTLSRPS
jgi:hypothetical protein